MLEIDNPLYGLHFGCRIYGEDQPQLLVEESNNDFYELMRRFSYRMAHRPSLRYIMKLLALMVEYQHPGSMFWEDVLIKSGLKPNDVVGAGVQVSDSYLLPVGCVLANSSAELIPIYGEAYQTMGAKKGDKIKFFLNGEECNETVIFKGELGYRHEIEKLTLK